MTASRPLLRCAPESQGISSAGILGFVEMLDQRIHDMHSFMLLRHGVVVAEGAWSPYAMALPHMMWSLSKSFTSTAVGLAQAEGRLSVYDFVTSFFPDDLPAKVSPNLAAMRVRDLLSMSTGHQKDVTDAVVMSGDDNWVRVFLSLPVQNQPGTHFVYNTAATYMLSAIVQKVTGMTTLDYLTPRLFEPLGIEKPHWETCPRGINTGGWGLKLKVEDIARFGQLYLQKGLWDGQRILPEAWVEEASARQSSNGSDPGSDWAQGYGYQFWRCRHGGYRGDGAFGQYCVILPEQDAVLAITSGVDDMQAVLNIAWDALLPEMGPEPLQANPTAQDALENKLRSLALPVQAGEASSATGARVSGLTYDFAPNKLTAASASFDFSAGGCTLTVRDGLGQHTVTCGSGEWLEGSTSLFVTAPNPLIAPRPQRVAASGAWITPSTYQMTLRFPEAPYSYGLTCKFSGSQVVISTTPHQQFGPARYPRLVGTAR